MPPRSLLHQGHQPSEQHSLGLDRSSQAVFVVSAPALSFFNPCSIGAETACGFQQPRHTRGRKQQNQRQTDNSSHHTHSNTAKYKDKHVSTLYMNKNAVHCFLNLPSSPPPATDWRQLIRYGFLICYFADCNPCVQTICSNFKCHMPWWSRAISFHKLNQTVWNWK